jgi:hypothetical protein
MSTLQPLKLYYWLHYGYTLRVSTCISHLNYSEIKAISSSQNFLFRIISSTHFYLDNIHGELKTGKNKIYSFARDTSGMVKRSRFLLS